MFFEQGYNGRILHGIGRLALRDTIFTVDDLIHCIHLSIDLIDSESEKMLLTIVQQLSKLSVKYTCMCPTHELL